MCAAEGGPARAHSKPRSDSPPSPSASAAVDVGFLRRPHGSRPKRLGGPIGDFSSWALNLCDYDQKPDTCGDIGLAPNSDYGAFEITAWDVGCAEAKRLAKQVARIAIKPSSLVDYSTHQDGFCCEGYSRDDTDGLPEITWTCSRDSAHRWRSCATGLTERGRTGTAG